MTINSIGGAVVRALFALIEGLVYWLKQEAIDLLDHEPHLFSRAEAAVLREEDYVLDGDGTARDKPMFLALPANFRFAFSMYARDVLPEFRIDTGGEGWAALRQSYEIRHRVTHPKRLVDLEITDDELASVRRTHDWIDTVLLRSLVEVNHRLKATTAELEARRDGLQASP